MSNAGDGVVCGPGRWGRPVRPQGARVSIDALRDRYRPWKTRLLLVGESAPASERHYNRAANLYRATREAFAAALSVSPPPEGEDFLAWFSELGCWLVDLADEPVNRSLPSDRVRAVGAGVPALAETLRVLQPERVVVVLRRIAPAVRRAASMAEFDDRAIDVLPFPTRQWRPVYVDQLAGIVRDVLGSGPATAVPRSPPTAASGSAIAEDSSVNGSPILHEVIADVLRSHGNVWLKPTAIAREIAERDLWRPRRAGSRIRLER